MNALELAGAIALQIASTLDRMSQDRRNFVLMVRERERQGYRIIDGGSTDGDGGFEYTDWRTGDVLASKGLSEFKWPDGNWLHIDRISEATSAEPELIPELPCSLADVIIYWTYEHEDEARMVLDGVNGS